ncbi:MAG: 2-amino-4-hydroxy-6-hydroxymethyldihydropteridine diphosphokinase [Paludibacteraceae bacterium]|nr:2-amino-4-hydroxy-6-hydroxymethyldihydropteridine diphosphokinase [Paludibacteraceae bacterium]
MTEIYLGLGSNLGDKRKNLENAIYLCHKLIGVFKANSRFMHSAPWGFQSDNSFLNAVIVLETPHSAELCLQMANAIEREMGRVRTGEPGYHDRIIDIDILQYGDEIIDLPHLQVPHPLMLQREFVLRPMAELAPSLVHPVVRKTYKELLDDFLKAQQSAMSNLQ